MDIQQEIITLKIEKAELEAKLVTATGEREVALLNAISSIRNEIAAYVNCLPSQAPPAGLFSF
jgi:hypothetical protein